MGQSRAVPPPWSWSPRIALCCSETAAWMVRSLFDSAIVASPPAPLWCGRLVWEACFDSTLLLTAAHRSIVDRSNRFPETFEFYWFL